MDARHVLRSRILLGEANWLGRKPRMQVKTGANAPARRAGIACGWHLTIFGVEMNRQRVTIPTSRERSRAPNPEEPSILSRRQTRKKRTALRFRGFGIRGPR